MSYVSTLFGRGGFADVLDLSDGTVVKLYKRMPHTNDQVQHWSDHDAITRMLSRVEFEAYQQLQDHPAIERFISRFFGSVAVSNIQLPSDLSPEQYVTGYGIRLEKIIGREAKVAHLNLNLHTRVGEVLESIRDTVGELNVWDSSCFVPGSRAEFCLIDFALWDGYVEATEILAFEGRLPPDLRSHLRR